MRLVSCVVSTQGFVVGDNRQERQEGRKKGRQDRTGQDNDCIARERNEKWGQGGRRETTGHTVLLYSGRRGEREGAMRRSRCSW